METVGEVKEAHPEGGGDRSAPHFPSDVPGKLVPVEGKPAGPLPDGETASADPQDDTSLNARLLDKLNEQFEKQIQLVENERLDDGFKVSRVLCGSHLRRLTTATMTAARHEGHP